LLPFLRVMGANVQKSTNKKQLIRQEIADSLCRAHFQTYPSASGRQCANFDKGQTNCSIPSAQF